MGGNKKMWNRERKRRGGEKREKRDKRWREGEEIGNEREGRHKKGDVSYHSLTRGGDWNFFAKISNFRKQNKF